MKRGNFHVRSAEARNAGTGVPGIDADARDLATPSPLVAIYTAPGFNVHNQIMHAQCASCDWVGPIRHTHTPDGYRSVCEDRDTHHCG